MEKHSTTAEEGRGPHRRPWLRIILAMVLLGLLLTWGSYSLLRPGGSLSAGPESMPHPSATASSPSVPSDSQGSAFLQELGLTLIHIPAGSFLMGKEDSFPDETPVHEVQLNEYWMARTEVTNDQYAAFVRETDHPAPLGDSSWNAWSDQSPPLGYEDHPVVNVSWDDAVGYCEWLSRRTGHLFRLPTESEWEHACRAGTSTTYSWGEEWDCSQAMAENDVGSGDAACLSMFQARGLRGDQTAPAGFFPANPWGFLDLHGNVLEWCVDWYELGHYSEAAPLNPTGPDSGTYRVGRGGSWYNPSGFCSSVFRDRFKPDRHYSYLGFRPVREGS